VPVVSNASPLIALADIEQLDLLTTLFGSIVIPPAVAGEIARTVPAGLPWLRVENLTGALPRAVQRPSLGAGEREAISLAAELHADWLIVDDLPARRVARALDLRVIGTLGVLLAAKRRALVPQLRPLLDRLVAQSFFIGPDLYAELLHLAEESET
jgi:hypothetical protein